ncbi:Hypothetical protein Cp262_1897 [Corynebacterium pseudotuberculosis]|nr:Hypothetical protein Cp3995_1987 [Corynebacterium pseudotuberculosis 3/99-5]AKC74703.1 Hypothetical protein Cp226_2015 [Corynebacterium pseudotuberculosis]AKP09528.1 Hypothetical protein Cp262_1897 [Corynebacterium pseudotuberculosis]ARS60216.1 Hypothetical protein CpATCC19410_0735 [Corynebacterium pseudotuberculosis]AUY61414.1 Hypothetical protein BFG00_2031 [Corynebacterium pseudotuberculosis]
MRAVLWPRAFLRTAILNVSRYFCLRCAASKGDEYHDWEALRLF